MRKFLAAGALLLTAISTAFPAGIFGPPIVKNPFTTNSAANTPVSIGPAPRILAGGGDPEGSVTANIGSLYLRTNATGGFNLYSKTNAGFNSAGWWPVQGGGGAAGGPFILQQSGKGTNLSVANPVTFSFGPTNGTLTVTQRCYITAQADTNKVIAAGFGSAGVDGTYVYVAGKSYHKGTLGLDFSTAVWNITNSTGTSLYADTVEGVSPASQSWVVTGGAGPAGTTVFGDVTNCFGYFVASLTEEITTSTNIYVDASLGNDTNGVRGIVTRPFKTLYGALSVATNNDCILLGPGNYPSRNLNLGTQIAEWIIPPGVKIVGLGPGVTSLGSSTDLGSIEEEILRLHSDCVLANMDVNAAVYVGNVAYEATNAAFINLHMIGERDCVYLDKFAGTITVDGSDLLSAFDAFSNFDNRVVSNRFVIIRNSQIAAIKQTESFQDLHALQDAGRNVSWTLINSRVVARNGNTFSAAVFTGVATTNSGSMTFVNCAIENSNTNGPTWGIYSSNQCAFLMINSTVTTNALFLAGAGSSTIAFKEPLYDSLTLRSNLVAAGTLTVGGPATNNADLAVRSAITINASNSANASVTATAVSNGIPQMLLRKGRSGEAVPTQILAGDAIGNLEFDGRDNASSWRTAFRLVPSALSDFTGSSGETLLVFTFGRNAGTTADIWFLSAYNWTNFARAFFKSNAVFELGAKFPGLTSGGVLGLDSGTNVISLTGSGVLDLVGSTRGSVLYRGASGWSALVPGTAGQLLQTAGAGADPLWVTSGTLTDSDKGDITVTGSGATWTVDAGAITYAKIVNGTARSVLGRSANSSGVLADIQAASDGQVLRQVASALGWGAVDLTSANAVSGILPRANTPSQVVYDDEANTFTLEQAFSGPLKLTASAISASDIDWALGPTRTKTLSANTTFTFSNLADDRWLRIFLTQDGTGGRTVAWPAGIVWMTSTNQSDPPVAASLANAVCLITLERSAGTVRGWYSGPDSIPLVDIASITGWAKGDLLVWDGTHEIRLARGTDGQHLISSNASSAGLAWVDQNASGSGSTQMVAAAVGWLTMTNQIIYIPQEFNGSNTVNNYAWDMKLNTFKPVTNFVNTNMVFTLSNITAGASLISEFIGNPGTTNTILIQAVSGANIKWKGWDTNKNGGGLFVRGGYSYTFQAFADRTTNVSAWVTTDDPYAVGPIISIVTNDLVINVRYTNTASTVSYVQCSMTLNAGVTDIAQAVLLIDQNGDGTWDAWITNRVGSGVAMADSILMGGWVTNSGIFLITNQSTGSATATINPNSSQRISGFGTGPQGLTGPSGVQVFNSLPQSQTNYLPVYDRRMSWGAYFPNNNVAPVGQGNMGIIASVGTLQNNQPASETNSQYGIIRATGGSVRASVQPSHTAMFVPTNRVFYFTATLGFSNAPGTNEMHMEIVSSAIQNLGNTIAQIGWFAETKGSAQTNWTAMYRSNNTTQINVYVSTAMTDQWHTLGVANTNGSTLVWYLDGVPVATLATPGLASPGGVGCIPVIGEQATANPGPCFMFWQDFELLHEKTLPVSTGPL